MAGATSTGTGTNVQESGVDEPDVVKSDGELLVRVQDDELTAYDVTGDEPAYLDAVDLPGVADAELLLVGDTVVAIGTDEAQRYAGVDDAHPPCGPSTSATRPSPRCSTSSPLRRRA